MRQFRRAGLRVGVGTDSVLSVGRPDLLAEVSSVRALLGASQALRLATLAGAEALGLDHEVGSIAVGKWGDLCAIEVGAADSGEIEDRVLAAGTPGVVGTWLAGRRTVSTVARRPTRREWRSGSKSTWERNALSRT